MPSEASLRLAAYAEYPFKDSLATFGNRARLSNRKTSRSKAPWRSLVTKLLPELPALRVKKA
eukprot:5717682-Pleurochrysis_carterae.AAC.3